MNALKLLTAALATVIPIRFAPAAPRAAAAAPPRLVRRAHAPSEDSDALYVRVFLRNASDIRITPWSLITKRDMRERAPWKPVARSTRGRCPERRRANRRGKTPHYFSKKDAEQRRERQAIRWRLADDDLTVMQPAAPPVRSMMDLRLLAEEIRRRYNAN